MPRTFASGDKIRTAIGACNFLGAVTFAAIVKPNATRDANWRNIITTLNSSGAPQGWAFEINNSNKLFFTNLTLQAVSATSVTSADGWVLLVATKAAGSATPRLHRYRFSDGSWFHENGAAPFGDGTLPGSSGLIDIGGDAGGSGDIWVGDMQVAAEWNVALTDAQVEWLPHSLTAWLGAKGLWLLDQSATTQKVGDLTGGGANESTLTGTSVTTGAAPVFSYGALPQRVLRSGAAGHTVALGTASESDTAQPLGRLKAKALGVAIDTSSAIALGRNKAKPLGAAAETDTAIAVGKAKARALGAAAETETAIGLGRLKRKLLGLAGETDTALTITASGAHTVAVTTATETDAALTIGRLKQRTIVTAGDTETGLTLGRAKRRTISLATDTSTAPVLARAKSRTLGTATATNTAQPIGRLKRAALGAAFETDTAVAVVAHGSSITIPHIATIRYLAYPRATLRTMLTPTAELGTTFSPAVTVRAT